MSRLILYGAAMTIWLPEVAGLPLPVAFYAAKTTEMFFGWSRYVDVVFHVVIAGLAFLTARVPAFMVEFLIPRQYPVGYLERFLSKIPRSTLLWILGTLYVGFGYVIYDGPYGHEDDIIGLGFYILRPPIFFVSMLAVAIPMRFLEQRACRSTVSLCSALLLRSFSSKLDGILFRSIPHALKRGYKLDYLLPPINYFPSTLLASLPSLSMRFDQFLTGTLRPLVSTDQEWAHFIRERIRTASIIIVETTEITPGVRNEFFMLAEEKALGKTIFLSRNDRPKQTLLPMPSENWITYQTNRWPHMTALVSDSIPPFLLAAYIEEHLPVSPWNWIVATIVFLAFVIYNAGMSRIAKCDLRKLRDCISLHASAPLRPACTGPDDPPHRVKHM